MPTRTVFATGETIRARATYSDPDTGVLLDPATVSVAIRPPSGAIVTYVYLTDAELTRVSLGVFQVSIPLTEVGTYKWKWTGTATNKSAVDYDECDSEKKAGF